MLLVYFTAVETLNYNYSEIYDNRLHYFLSPIMHYTSIFTIIFSFLLIFIILVKTPKNMGFFKAYLLLYVFNTLLLEIVMLLFKPFLMHPFFAIYSLELGNALSTKSLLILFIFMSYFACGLIDCIVGMSAERYFAFKNMHTKRQSKAPIIIFAVFSGSSLAYLCLATIAVCFESVRDALVLPENEAFEFLAKHLDGSLASINPASILIFRPDIPVKSFATGFGIFVSFVFSRYIFAIFFLILNATKTKISTIHMSDKIKKNNKMLLRCIYAQFFGFCTFAGFPAFAIVATFYFLSKPNSIISFCFLLMNCFGLYDIFVTIIFIKPYRSFFVKIFEYATFKFSRCSSKINPNLNKDLKSAVPVGKIFDATSFALK